MTFKSNTLSYFSWIFVAVCLASAGVIGLLQSHATLLSLLAIVLAFVASIAAMKQFRQQQDEIQAFIGALTYQDFTLRISDSASLAPRYQKACNNILKRMQREKNRQEERLLLMENLMQALESGIILVRNEQDVLLCNNAAKSNSILVR